MMAESKSLRQESNTEQRTDLYMWTKPEDTVSWKAADAITALSEDNARLKAEREWQPIETAPKDGKIWVGFYRKDGSCFADPETVASRERDYPPRTEFYVGRLRVYPTHWRPLPDPPALQHEGGNHEVL